MNEEMDGIYSTHGRVKMRAIFWLETLNRRDHLEDLGIGGRIMLE
jgi:hypothetical protein